MSKFGWDLPPGVSVRDLPGNRPEDLKAEARDELIYEKLDTVDKLADDDKTKDKLAEIIGDLMDQAYHESFTDGRADEQMFSSIAKENSEHG